MTPPGAPGCGPRVTAEELSAPLVDPGAHWPGILTWTVGLWRTEPWDLLGQENPSGFVQDIILQGKNQEASWWLEEEWTWRRNKHRKKGDKRGHPCANRAGQYTYLMCTVLMSAVCLVFSLNSNSSPGWGTLFRVHVCVRWSTCQHLPWEPLVTGPDTALENVHEDNFLLRLFLSLSFGTVKWKRLLNVLQTFTGKLISAVFVCYKYRASHFSLSECKKSRLINKQKEWTWSHNFPIVFLCQKYIGDLAELTRVPDIKTKL